MARSVRVGRAVQEERACSNSTATDVRKLACKSALTFRMFALVLCNRRQKRCGDGRNVSRKLMPEPMRNRLRRVPGASEIDPKSSKNRSWDPSRASKTPQSGPGASKGRPASVRERPRGAPRVAQESPGSSRGHSGTPKGTPGSVPRRPKWTPSRPRERKNQVFYARLVRECFLDRFFDDLCRFLVFSQSVRTL